MLRRHTFALDGSTGFHVTWHGKKRMSADWGPESRSLAMQWTQTYPNGSRDDLHFIAHAHWEDTVFELPDIEKRKWFRLVDTALPSPQDIAAGDKEFKLSSQDSYSVTGRSVAIFIAK
jgi:glycogen operon protein